MVRSRRRERFADEAEMMDTKAIARSAADFFGTGLERATESAAIRRSTGTSWNVDYRDTIRDPLGVLRRIYDHFGFDYTKEFEARVKAHVAAPRQTGHGQHHYDPNECGIAELHLEDQFPRYRARFGHLIGNE